MGFEADIFSFRSELAKRCVLPGKLCIGNLKIERVLPKFTIQIELYHVVAVAKSFVLYFCQLIFVSVCCLTN